MIYNQRDALDHGPHKLTYDRSPRDPDLAPRRTFTYRCPKGHDFEVPFSDDAEAPATWECRLHAEPARRADGADARAKASKPPRTHWDMLLERRSVPEIEELLDERLGLLKERRSESTDKRPHTAERPGGGPIQDATVGHISQEASATPALVSALSKALDLELGLADIVVHTEHDDVVNDVNNTLHMYRGLRDILAPALPPDGDDRQIPEV